MLGVELYDYQKAPLVAIAGGARRVAVTSGHGTGKSTDAAVVAVWFLLTRFPCRVVMTAPTLAQLESVLMGQIRSYIEKLPIALQDLLEVQNNKIFLRAAPDDAWISARTARAESPEALAGIHAEHVLLMADEASGIPEAVFEHAIGSMSGENACTLLLSNPTRRVGTFFKIFNNPIAGEGWVKFRFSCRESPLVSEEFIKQVEDMYGKDSNQVRVRVDGLFPTEDLDAFMNGAAVQEATERDVKIDFNTDGILGVDVARFGSDRSALCMRRGPVVEEIMAWEKKDLMETTGKVIAYIAAMPEEHRPREINVDGIGLGAGVADRLAEVCSERGWPIVVNSINVAEAATLDERAYKLKDEIWLKARDWINLRDCRIPDEKDFVDDILAPGYDFSSSGKIKIESKQEMRRRGVKSTDLGDAFALTFAGSAASLLNGHRSSWATPLRRNLRGVF